MIPIYIPSYNRAETIKTSLYLDACNIPYKVLLHTEAEREAYIKAGRVKADSIIVTNQPKGVTHQRNYIIKHLAKLGEWYISLDDNISSFKRFDDFIYNSADDTINVEDEAITQKNYNQNVPANEFINIITTYILCARGFGFLYTCCYNVNKFISWNILIVVFLCNSLLKITKC